MGLNATVSQFLKAEAAKLPDEPDHNVLNHILRVLARWRQALVLQVYLRREGPVIWSGPFQGMQYQASATEGAVLPRLLGVYESELHPALAAFAAEGVPTVQGRLVRSGRLSWEYRPYLLFPTDPGIFLLLRCQGAAGFFPSIDRLYATQATWQAPLRSMTEAQRQELQGLTAQQRIVRLTQMTGVDRFFAQRGMSPARISACLSDQRRLDQLLNWSRVANAQLQVQGTPTFFLNGTKLDNVYDWAALQPHLPAP